MTIIVILIIRVSDYHYGNINDERDEVVQLVDYICFSFFFYFFVTDIAGIFATVFCCNCHGYYHCSYTILCEQKRYCRKLQGYIARHDFCTKCPLDIRNLSQSQNFDLGPASLGRRRPKCILRGGRACIVVVRGTAVFRNEPAAGRAGSIRRSVITLSRPFLSPL